MMAAVKKKQLRKLEHPDIERKHSSAVERSTFWKSYSLLMGPILIQTAQNFAKILGHTDFQTSSGWLDKFIQKHRITHKQACGEEAAVNKDAVQKCKDYDLTKLLTD